MRSSAIPVVMLASVVTWAGSMAPAAVPPEPPTTAGAAHAGVDPAPAPGGQAGPTVDVVVTGEQGVRGLGDAVARLGGQVTRLLPIVHGLAATVPVTALDDLVEVDGVRGVTPDTAVRVATATSSASVTGAADGDASRAAMGVDDAHRAGLTGRGVTVALVDTGVADVPDLDGRVVPVVDDLTGRRRPCVDFSGEDHCRDSYGHGTFLAGLIAGDGSSSDGRWRGVAPGAEIVSVKVAGRDGASDVSTVLGAIQWVVSFRDRYGIDVLNLSLGTDSRASWRTDPFNYAVERAWDAGIVVVASAGNLGPHDGTVSKPGDDPWVVTVGAVDPVGTPGLGDDLLPDFSARGPAPDGVAKPDVVAPGAHVVSLRAPGSAVDDLPGVVDDRHRRGSGTSMSAALVSGAAALAVEAGPGRSPDEVKHALVATARRTASDDPTAVGAGMVDARATALDPPPGRANQGLGRSSGTGPLDASRGGVRVHTEGGLLGLLSVVVQGGLTAQTLLWDPVAYTTGRWEASPWYSSSWVLAPLLRVSWHGDNWHGDNWHGASWYGEDRSAGYGRPARGGAWLGAWG